MTSLPLHSMTDGSTVNTISSPSLHQPVLDVVRELNHSEYRACSNLRSFQFLLSPSALLSLRLSSPPLPSHSGDFIIGRVIRAMGATWHPECFKCILCHKELADIGFVKHKGGM